MASNATPDQLGLQTTARVLRRKYAKGASWAFNGQTFALGTVEGLDALCEVVTTAATQEITLHENSFEGGHAAGTITYNRMWLLTAIMDLLAELDPPAVEEETATARLVYSCRQVEG